MNIVALEEIKPKCFFTSHPNNINMAVMRT